MLSKILVPMMMMMTMTMMILQQDTQHVQNKQTKKPIKYNKNTLWPIVD